MKTHTEKMADMKAKLASMKSTTASMKADLSERLARIGVLKQELEEVESHPSLLVQRQIESLTRQIAAVVSSTTAIDRELARQDRRSDGAA